MIDVTIVRLTGPSSQRGEWSVFSGGQRPVFLLFTVCRSRLECRVAFFFVRFSLCGFYIFYSNTFMVYKALISNIPSSTLGWIVFVLKLPFLNLSSDSHLSSKYIALDECS